MIYEINQQINFNISERARQSHGVSCDAIYEMVARTIAAKHSIGGTLVDIGCGEGRLWSFVSSYITKYIGVDAVLYDTFPQTVEFVNYNLDAGNIPLGDEVADIVCAVETIEHLENPRAFMRELIRLTKPGGLVLVTTPNQLSLLSKLTLILKNQFNAFQEAPGLYPAHITALLEIDLIHIATECGLIGIHIDFSHEGRIPFTSWHYPKFSGFQGRAFSDNLICVGIKPRI